MHFVIPEQIKVLVHHMMDLSGYYSCFISNYKGVHL